MVFVYNKSRAMITCCNDGTRLVIFKIERIEIDKVFDFDETKDVFNLIVSLLKKQ